MWKFCSPRPPRPIQCQMEVIRKEKQSEIQHYIWNDVTHRGTGHFSKHPQSSLGNKILLSSNGISWKQMVLKVSLREKYFTLRMKQSSHRYGSSAVPEAWTISCIYHSLWVKIGSISFGWARANTQRHHLSFAEQPSKAMWRWNQAQAGALSQETHVMGHLPCAAWWCTFLWVHHICLRWAPVKQWSCANLNRMFCWIRSHPSQTLLVCSCVFLSHTCGCASHRKAGVTTQKCTSFT